MTPDPIRARLCAGSRILTASTPRGEAIFRKLPAVSWGRPQEAGGGELFMNPAPGLWPKSSWKLWRENGSTRAFFARMTRT